MISQMTPAGIRPASRARSTAASVCPALARVPPSLACSGKMCPGRTRSKGPVAGSMAALTVQALSKAEMPVRNAFLGVDGYGERGFEPGRVFVDHERQLELGQPLRCQGEADEPAPVAAHEIDDLGCDLLGGDHQVAFVFAVLIVDDDDQASGADLLQRLLNRDDPGVCVHQIAPISSLFELANPIIHIFSQDVTLEVDCLTSFEVSQVGFADGRRHELNVKGGGGEPELPSG